MEEPERNEEARPERRSPEPEFRAPEPRPGLLSPGPRPEPRFTPDQRFPGDPRALARPTSAPTHPASPTPAATYYRPGTSEEDAPSQLLDRRLLDRRLTSPTTGLAAADTASRLQHELDEKMERREASNQLSKARAEKEVGKEKREDKEKEKKLDGKPPLIQRPAFRFLAGKLKSKANQAPSTADRVETVKKFSEQFQVAQARPDSPRSGPQVPPAPGQTSNAAQNRAAQGPESPPATTQGQPSAKPETPRTEAAPAPNQSPSSARREGEPAARGEAVRSERPTVEDAKQRLPGAQQARAEVEQRQTVATQAHKETHQAPAEKTEGRLNQTGSSHQQEGRGGSEQRGGEQKGQGQDKGQERGGQEQRQEREQRKESQHQHAVREEPIFQPEREQREGRRQRREEQPERETSEAEDQDRPQEHAGARPGRSCTRCGLELAGAGACPRCSRP